MSTANYQLKFGKHANKPLSEVPNDYLVYMLNNNDNLYDSVKEKIRKHLNENGVSTELPQEKPSGSEWVFSYGKHKGLMVSEVPKEYLEWTMKNEKTVEGVKKHIQKHLNSIA